MKEKNPYTLRDYFNRATETSQISETQLRQIVETKSSEVDPEVSFQFQRRFVMPAFLSAIALVGTIIIVALNSPESSDEGLNNSAQKNERVEKKADEIRKERSANRGELTTSLTAQVLPENETPAPAVGGIFQRGADRPTDGSLDGNDDRRPEQSLLDREEKNPADLAPLLAKMGYRMNVGQILFYELTFDQQDNVNDDSFVSKELAKIEVEAVDANGNITMKISTKHLGHQWKKEDVHEAIKAGRVFGGDEIVRVLVSREGEYLDGWIIRDPDREAWLAKTNDPGFGGGQLSTERNSVAYHADRWISVIPPRSEFDRQGRAKVYTLDTVPVGESLFKLYDDPANHLDTIDGTIVYVSARARGITSDKNVPTSSSSSPSSITSSSSLLSSSASPATSPTIISSSSSSSNSTQSNSVSVLAPTSSDMSSSQFETIASPERDSAEGIGWIFEGIAVAVPTIADPGLNREIERKDSIEAVERTIYPDISWDEEEHQYSVAAERRESQQVMVLTDTYWRKSGVINGKSREIEFMFQYDGVTRTTFRRSDGVMIEQVQESGSTKDFSDNKETRWLITCRLVGEEPAPSTDQTPQQPFIR